MILGSGTVAAFLETSKGYMMETATSAVVDAKMEPIGKSPITQQLVITGQVLYDTFVQTDDSQVTKMNLIRGLVGKADALQIKGACDAMVEKAKTIDGEMPKGERGVKTQSAMNCRTVIQQAWGALTYADSALSALGYTERTGYQDMRVIAKKALEAAKVDWKGQPLPTDADKARKATQRANKVESDILIQTQKDNPRLAGESLGEWGQRTLELATDAMEDAIAAKDAELATREYERISKGLTANQLFLLTKMLIENSPVEFSVTETSVEEPVTA